MWLFTIGFVVSSLGVHLSNTKKAASRRLSALKENAARAFGITRNEIDHHQLQQMQLRRASAIGGQTKVGEVWLTIEAHHTFQITKIH